LNATQWFERASRYYVEGHQACPWCAQRHCLFRRRWGGRLEYHCSGCEFSTCQDERNGAHYWIPGLEQEPV
jgi:hypothetical protein